jgi:hypothetical protein
MNKYFIVTVDTEADWFHQKENRLNNIQSIHSFQKICKYYKISPTYLTTYEVINNKDAVDVLKIYHKKDLCEIGSHLHIWSTPPFDNSNGSDMDLKWYPGFQSELPDQSLYDKLEMLSNKIFEVFGIYPTSHRAGRWGIDGRTINWLEQNDYMIDSSICSRKTWRMSRGVKGSIGYDSYKVKDAPYYPSIYDITKEKKNNHSILELPVSNFELEFLSNSNSKAVSLLSVISNKLGINRIGNISFRPSFDISLDNYKMLVEELFKKDKIFLNFMLHSNELSLGNSPYSFTIDKHNRLIERIKIVFEAANKFGYKSIKLSQAVDYV